MPPTGGDSRLPVAGDVSTPPSAVESLAYGELSREGTLAVGSNATVYAATGPSGTEMALKEPHVGPPVPAALRERFEREARAWRRVADHPHVVSLYDAGTEPVPWLALERIGGGTLGDRLGDDRISVAEALWIGTRLADALADAHEAGVVHQDVTPENVLLRETPGDAWPMPALSDWGIAALLEETAANPEGLSLRYAAPEQVAPDRFGPPGTETDVYQLGAVVYEALTGEPPFAGAPRQVRHAVLEDPPAPATGVTPDLPGPVDDLLDRALAKDPAERYDSAGAFAAAMANLLASVTGADVAVDVETDATVDAAPAGTAPYDRAVLIDDQGFVQLTEGYLARRKPAPLLTAWRRGLPLVDVHAGRAVVREPPEGGGDAETMTGTLLKDLRAGTDRAVLGPPASGKSVVCKQVACAWFDAGHGPVFYRESDASAAFDDPAALARELARTDGHALVVVEDAIRPDARAVFDLLDRTTDIDDVSVLVDARESEWREAGRGADPLGDAPVATGRERLTPAYVPRPDAEAFDRFVKAVEATTDRSFDVARLREDVRLASAGGDGHGDPRPGELFYLIHRLTALAGEPMAEDPPSTLTDAVAALQEDLGAASERPLDVGIAVNLLNAVGIGVHPELVYAVAPESPVAVDDAMDALEGRVLFPREADWSDGTAPYPAVHEAVSTEFLACLPDDIGTTAAEERVGRVVTRLLAVADDPGVREQVAGLLHGDAPYLQRVAADPGEWADATVKRLFGAGQTASSLAPLFGETGESSIRLPDACSPWTRAQQAYWRGVTFRVRGDLDAAEREFRTFLDRLESTNPSDGAVPDPAATGTHDGSEGAGRDAARRRDGWRAVALMELGRVAYKRRELDTASDRHGEALALCREVDDRRLEATAIKELGNVAYKRGEYGTARDRYEESLRLCREAGDRHREALVVNNLGNIANDRGAYEAARDRYEESLRLCRATGDRHREATALYNLGMVAREREALETATDRLEESLARFREIGDQHGEATALIELGVVAHDRDEAATAAECLEEGLDRARRVGDRQAEARALAYLGSRARRRGNLTTATERLEESLALCQRVGDPHGEAMALRTLGDIARDRGDIERARARFVEAAEAYLSIGDGEAIPALREVIEICDRQGDFDAATEWCQRAVEFADEMERPDIRREFATRLERVGSG